jgi:hypothetical protein
VQNNTEHWRELCSLAAEEKDLDKLLALVKEINRLLEQKEQRLREFVSNES